MLFAAYKLSRAQGWITGNSGDPLSGAGQSRQPGERLSPPGGARSRGASGRHDWPPGQDSCRRYARRHNPVRVRIVVSARGSPGGGFRSCPVNAEPVAGKVPARLYPSWGGASHPGTTVSAVCALHTDRVGWLEHVMDAFASPRRLCCACSGPAGRGPGARGIRRQGNQVLWLPRCRVVYRLDFNRLRVAFNAVKLAASRVPGITCVVPLNRSGALLVRQGPGGLRPR